ncbi:hypothetical protein [Escherichia coli]|uniref:hypothetical protein n=1 Tax=Escherichia coli TaxID=562 RepID=UPI002543B053|nr:hypothetical protein [Escherichia coli]
MLQGVLHFSHPGEWCFEPGHNGTAITWWAAAEIPQTNVFMPQRCDLIKSRWAAYYGIRHTERNTSAGPISQPWCLNETLMMMLEINFCPIAALTYCAGFIA